MTTRAGSCIFCGIVSGDLESSVVYDDDDFLAFMDIYPWRPGHLLVIPKRHAQYVHELDDASRRGLFSLAARLGEALRRSPIPSDDLHFLVNDGRAANQSVPHVHMHVLPRRRRDLLHLLAQLAKRPAIALLRPAPRERLDHHARAIAEALRGCP